MSCCARGKNIFLKYYTAGSLVLCMCSTDSLEWPDVTLEHRCHGVLLSLIGVNASYAYSDCKWVCCFLSGECKYFCVFGNESETHVLKPYVLLPTDEYQVFFTFLFYLYAALLCGKSSQEAIVLRWTGL